MRATSITSRPVLVQSFMVQAEPGNTGLIYVLRDENAEATAATVGDNRSSLAKVIAVIGIQGGTNATPGAFSFIMPNAQAAEDLRKIWIDAEVDGEGAIVSAGHGRAEPYV